MLEKLNTIIEKISICKKRIDLFKSLKPGDLVWAKMPISKKELLTIEESHRVRPYLVMKKNTFSLLAYPSSSKQSIIANNSTEYHINRLRYNKNRDSWISLVSLYKLPLFNAKSKYITLNNIDLNGIQKRLQIISEKHHKPMLNFNIPIFISEGDIINVNEQLYYVYSADNTYIYAFQVFKKCQFDGLLYTRIIINKKTYYTTFKEKEKFSRTLDIKISNLAFPSEIDIIEKQIKDNKYNSKLLRKSIKSKSTY